MSSSVARWHELTPCAYGHRLQAVCLDGGAGTASALKMAYASYTKGHAALMIAVRALARQLKVEDALLEEWERSQPGLAQRSGSAAARTAPKAWRFEGEMKEIAATFEAAGLPGEFHEAAAQIYGRLRELKDTSDLHTIERPLVFRKLLGIAAADVGNLANVSKWAAVAQASRTAVSRYLTIAEEAHISTSVTTPAR